MLNAAFAAAILLLQASPGAAPPSAQPAAAAAPGSVSPVTVKGQKRSVVEDNRVICHRQQVLGTLFPKEVCATKAQFAERRREDQAELDRDTQLRPYDANSGLPH
jgi:invasion protein IalB